MNSKDRERMGRLYSCMASLPFPNRNRTIGPQDAAEFLHNMGKLQKQFSRAIMAISRCDDPDEDPDREISNLEVMIAEGKSGLIKKY